MNRRKKWLAGGALVAILIVAGSGIAVAGGGKEGDTPLAGSDLDKAAAAALAHTGGGTVVESEVGDDGASYAVEIQLADGSSVEVSLDQSFKVIGSKADEDGANGPNDESSTDN
jgi:hypothetical protein